MTPSTPDTLAALKTIDPRVRSSPPLPAPPAPVYGRLLITAGLIFLYYWQRLPMLNWLRRNSGWSPALRLRRTRSASGLWAL